MRFLFYGSVQEKSSRVSLYSDTPEIDANFRLGSLRLGSESSKSLAERNRKFFSHFLLIRPNRTSYLYLNKPLDSMDFKAIEALNSNSFRLNRIKI